MAVKFFLNKQHVAYIDRGLIAEYRKVMDIPPERKDSRVIRDVMYKTILETEYYTEETDAWIDTIKRMAEFYKFKTVGDMFEYFMHKEMESRLDICKNCNYFENGMCLSDGRPVSKYKIGCRSLYPMLAKETEMDDFMKEMAAKFS